LIIFWRMASENWGPSSCSDSSSYTLPAASAFGAAPGRCHVVSLVSCAEGSACATRRLLVSGRSVRELKRA
jgi:hypothetical protein